MTESPLRTKEALESLRAIPLFSRVSDEDLEDIASHLIERRFPKNSTVVEEGLPGDYMYVICEGRVKVTKASDDGREKIMNFLDKGSFFGDMALLTGEVRSASVKTLEPTRLMALSRRDLVHLIRQSPDLALAVIEEVLGRAETAPVDAGIVGNLRQRSAAGSQDDVVTDLFVVRECLRLSAGGGGTQ